MVNARSTAPSCMVSVSEANKFILSLSSLSPPGAEGHLDDRSPRSARS